MKHTDLFDASIYLCFAILLSYAKGTEAQSVAAVGPDIVWQPTPRTLQMMRETCTNEAPAKYGE